MKHFSDYLQRAIRLSHGTDSSNADAPPSPPMTDWSAYYVDYRLLKSHVSSYMRRRMKLAELLRDGDQVYLTEEDLRLVLAMADDVEDTPTTTDIRRRDDDIVRMVMEDHIGDGQQGSGTTCTCTAENMLGSAACHDYFQYVDEPHDLQPLDPTEAERRLSRVERSSFTRLLDQELERAASFHSTQLVYLSKSIAALDDDGTERGEQKHESQPTANMPDSTPAISFTEVKEQYERVGNEILELLAFVVTNVICLRQILIRYDAFVRTFDGRPLTQWYFQEKMGNSDGMDGASSDHLTDIFHLEALLELETSFAAQMAKTRESYGDGDKSNAVEYGSVSSPYLQAFTKQAAGFRSLLDKTSISVSRAAGGHIVKRDRFVNTMRTLQFYFLRGSGLRGMAMEPKLLLMRGRHLKEEMRMIAVWRETREFSAASQKDEGEMIDPKNILPLLLNLIACFIYMMGHYIIEPSSAYYAEALGFDDSMAGLMMGLSPTFAIVSAVGYSIWTNHNYKTPILFACSLAFVGNLLYACALSYQSMTICLVGRALTGLGATKVINRRYVADATTVALRTPANAALALGTALGAAMGPALALVIADLDFNFVLPLFGQQNFNAMTGPGFIMALLWLLFAIVASFAFTEPVRSGVEELKQREAVSPSDPPSPLMRHKSGCFTKNADNEWDKKSLEEAMEVITKSSKSGSLRHCLQNMTKPVVVTMAIIFMKRVALEFLVGSTSIITKNRYGWSIKNVGTLHFANGMIVIPITILAGWLSQFFQDRYLTLRFMVITLVGLLSLIDFSDLLGSAADENDTYNEGYPLAIGPVRYIIGSLVTFSSIEANESYVASMMSKLLPSQLAVGTFNSGLLIILVAMSARATADIFITILGSISIRYLLNMLIIPSTCLVATSLLLVWRNFEALAV